MASGGRQPQTYKAVQRPFCFPALRFQAFTLIAPALAQETNIDSLQPKLPEDAKMLLSANELVYNQDAKRVIVRGGVQINYGGYKMVAQQVEYSQKTGRIIATGEIEMIEPGGNRIYADKMDVTDNFANGFIEAMRIETTDTHKAGCSHRRARQRRGDDPQQCRLYRLHALRDQSGSSLALARQGRSASSRTARPIPFAWKMPSSSCSASRLLYLPVLEVPDHTVKRKSGFLFPKFRYTQKLGAGVGVPYYWAISPYMDATVTATGLTRQGFLLEGEFRQRFENGEHTSAWPASARWTATASPTAPSMPKRTARGMVASKAKFKINPRWTFGWDVLVQSDNNFAKTYELSTFDGHDLYEPGLSDGSRQAQLLRRARLLLRHPGCRPGQPCRKQAGRRAGIRLFLHRTSAGARRRTDRRFQPDQRQAQPRGRT